MQAPPGPSGPQLSPDGNYWWDGLRWIPLVQPQVPWQVPPAYQPPLPSRGLLPFLITFLVLADIVTVLLALSGVLALLNYAGVGGPYDGPPVDIVNYLLIGYFELVAAMTILATVGVVTRSGAWARVVTIVAGVLISLSCVGVLLGIPIVIAATRAPMSKPAPTGYA